MTNIAELLKDVPKGMKLYSPLFGEVNFVGVDKQSDYPINVTDCKGNGKSFTEFGVYFADHPDAECLLFLSKEVRTWENFKLPAKTKFKVGDWLFYKNCGIHPILVKDYSEQQGYKVECLGLTYCIQKGVVENEYRFWTIEDAKDGDVLAFGWTQDNGASHWEKIVIFKKYHAKGVKGLLNSPCVEGYGNTFKNGKLVLQEEVPYYSKTWTATLQPATKEQCDLLFAKMREAGYEWDADKKELRKIQHYDISNFHAGMPVLVRDGDSDDDWTYALFSHYNSTRTSYKFSASGDVFRQCIPFEGNESLLGTTDMPSEEYINW